MARQLAPEFIGVLKTDEDALKTWEVSVYRVSDRITRLEARKRPNGRTQVQQESRLKQMRLVYADGSEV